ncbi:MAG TPA: hypothetical protein VEQ85_01900 [Lacipirellulaceae bacterium]|nr:hypothetical protein [Lacipirellulaceae bacterium]
MATRENQGLQAFIIGLVILTIGLLVGLLLVNNARKTQVALVVSAQQASSEASRRQAEAQSDAATFKELMGFGEAETAESIREAFTADMAKWAAGTPAESQQYRTVLANVYEERNKLMLNAATATQEVQALKERLLAVEAQKDAELDKYSAELEKIRADAASEREKFEEQYARINAEKDGIQKQMDELRAEHDTAVETLDAEKTTLQNQIGKLETSIDKLRQAVPSADQFAQPADGSITWVNQRFGTVWVNLGSADGLRPQVTFAVAEAGLDDAAAAEKKGSIEITQILGPHQAEARVTNDTATNPLLPGDRIFSQVWDRGRQVGIGVAGFVDLDADGVSDLEKLKAIVAASGGTVDAAPDESGKKEGALKVSTRYLVLGEFPQDARSGDLRSSWDELSQEAEALGVETVALDEFLSLIGWRSESRSVNMGPGARPEDFPATVREQEMPRETGQPAGVFKRRLPNRSY